MRKYRTSDFDYELPKELIAQHPLADRTASRLMRLDPHRKSIKHNIFNEIKNYLRPDDLLVLNDTKVMPARLYGRKESGGHIECLIERVLVRNRVWAHIKASKAPKVNTQLCLENVIFATVEAKIGDIYQLKINNEKSIINLLLEYGAVPLPPYIQRDALEDDQIRYQTIYAEKLGAVAAPTAGLHFDRSLLADIRQLGVRIAEVTLHVGSGTFQPMRTDELELHQMHHEWMEISAETCDLINHCKKKQGRVIAVGTTVVRCLETACKNGNIIPFCGDTNLFITPGYAFQCVDALITNFHLPKSTLLMLVSAFAGYQLTRQAYQEAILQKYRFFSYGDAMFILNKASR